MSPRSPSPLPILIAFCVIAAAVIGGGVLLVASRPAPVVININPPPPTGVPTATATPAPVEVYVTGAINQPASLVTLPAGSRISDVLAAVGGASANADLERIDLAALVHDGDHIHVYRLGEASTVIDGAQSGASAQPTLVHVNRATLAELETLPGIGPALAQRIIDYRSANGPFASLESLAAVSGIGDHIIQGLSGLVAFD